jgi:predicted TIM-barrel fold metal-dependent hydrolase
VGKIDLHFKPAVPVFDANASLGRRHDRRVPVDTAEVTLEAMDAVGVDRAVVYGPHAAGYDSSDGNALLLEQIGDESRLLPQFVCNPSWDELDEFTALVEKHDVRSVRMVPALHVYPFRDWVVKPWLDWLGEAGIPIWLPVNYDFLGTQYQVKPAELYETLSAHPDVTAVLSEVQYHTMSWAMPLLRSLPNLHVEISCLSNADGLDRLEEAVGLGRIMYGSRFPDAAIAPLLYYIHYAGLSDDALKDICSRNVERLLGLA